MSIEINDLGYSSSFESALASDKAYVSQGVRFHEYVNHEVTLAVENKTPEVIDALIRMMNFAKSTGLTTIYKEIPVKPRNISRALKKLTEEDKRKVQELILTLEKSTEVLDV
tara:strand:+ start:652 stop:987 length:336 start_codon:yes stop_codon:yes gene_type:complete